MDVLQIFPAGSEVKDPGGQNILVRVRPWKGKKIHFWLHSGYPDGFYAFLKYGVRRFLVCICLLYTSRQTGTPRAVAPLVPMGANAGGPHNVEQQTQIVKATLEQLEKIETPGKIVPLPFEYVAKI